MADEVEIERERIIAILRDEQSKCDDELSRMLIERIINRIYLEPVVDRIMKPG